MKKIQFYGMLYYANEWGKIDPEKATFNVPDEQNPYEFFHNLFTKNFPDLKYLITYNEIKE